VKGFEPSTLGLGGIPGIRNPRHPAIIRQADPTGFLIVRHSAGRAS
jgi:hypothetical protein